VALLAALRERLESVELARRLARAESDRGELVAAAISLVVCARELLIDTDEVGAGRLRTALDKLATNAAVAADDEDEGPARRLARAIDRHKVELLEAADKGRRYLRDREGELLDIIRTLGAGLSAMGQDGDGHAAELDATSGRLERLARLEDMRTLRAELGREVSKLRQITVDKRERDRSRVAALEREIEVLRGDVDEARKRAATDALTGAANRAAFDEELGRLVGRARTSGAPFTLLFVDVDHFKSINDRFGHQVGDRVLRGLAEVLGTAVRKDDMVARYGGEEFAVLLPGAKAKVGGAHRRAPAQGRGGPALDRRRRRGRELHGQRRRGRVPGRRRRDLAGGARRRGPVPGQAGRPQPHLRRLRRGAAPTIPSGGGRSPSSATRADRHRAAQYSGRPCEATLSGASRAPKARTAARGRPSSFAGSWS
jgi:GGDEF domain-containing protein